MIIGSYFTVNTPYEAEAARLRTSLDALALAAKIIGCPDRGHWQLNVKWRPAIILRLLNQYEQDVLFVDADATFARPPSAGFLESLDCDIAAHVMDKAYWGQQTDKRKFSLMAGTLFVKNNDAARELMLGWIQACKKSDKEKWDMRILESLVGFDPQTNRCGGPYRLGRLPVQYCAIDRTMPRVAGAVICHHQASRRLRRRIG